MRVNVSKHFPMFLSLLATLLPSLGQTSAEVVTADDLKAALHDVLSHNNLFDAVFVSDRLGIGLHISQFGAQDRDFTRVHGTATSNPPALYGSIEYEADVDRARQVSTAHLSFASRDCPSLRQWGSEWKVQTQEGMSTDGGPSYESLAWPGSEGISLMVSAGRPGCSVQMSQSLKRAISVPVSPATPRAPPSGLSKQIADLLLSDLRDYAQVGRILNTEFVVGPDSQRKGLLYRGYPFPGRVIPGFEPYFYYDGNDAGWYDPGVGGFFARRLHITDRSVILNLSVDREVVCLSQAQLASELGQRGRQIRKQRAGQRDVSVYSVRSANLVSMSVAFEDACANSLQFRQITDVARSLRDPIRFTLETSLDRSTGNLTDDAQRRLDLLASRLQHILLRGIEVQEIPGKHPTVTVHQDLSLLKQLITEAIRRKGEVKSPRANTDDTGVCGERQQPEEPAVCVDVWQ
jgi:hypothetical protein